MAGGGGRRRRAPSCGHGDGRGTRSPVPRHHRPLQTAPCLLLCRQFTQEQLWQGAQDHLAPAARCGGCPYTLTEKLRCLVVPSYASEHTNRLKQPNAGFTVDIDLKHGRTTLHLGFLIGSDKSLSRGRTHVRQVKILGHAAETPWMRVA